MFVCICAQVPEAELREAIAAGARDLAAIGTACGAGTNCGHCVDRVEDILDEIAGPAWVPGAALGHQPLLPLVPA